MCVSAFPFEAVFWGLCVSACVAAVCLGQFASESNMNYICLMCVCVCVCVCARASVSDVQVADCISKAVF